MKNQTRIIWLFILRPLFIIFLIVCPNRNCAYFTSASAVVRLIKDDNVLNIIQQLNLQGPTLSKFRLKARANGSNDLDRTISLTVGAIFIAAVLLFIYKQVVRKKSSRPVQQLKLEDVTEHCLDKNNAESMIMRYARNNIASDTEKMLLRKLELFEKSGKYLKKEMSLTYLASQLGTNPKYLSEIIRNSKSQNYNSYINRLRIDYIVDKLNHDPVYREYKISYLADECGYASPQVFVIAFKKIKGVTPSYFMGQLKGQRNSNAS